MTIPRTKPGGWSHAQKPTGKELTELDAHSIRMVDKSGDTVTGEIEFSSTASLEFNSGADGYIQSNADGYVAGDLIVQSNGLLTFESASSWIFESGATYEMQGVSQFQIASTASLYGTMAIESTTTVASGADLTIQTGGEIVLGDGYWFGVAGYTTSTSTDIGVHESPRIIGASATALPEAYNLSNMPCIRTATQADATGTLMLRIPAGPPGAVLYSVRVLTRGIDGAGLGTLTLPIYQIRYMAADGSVVNLGTQKTDLHTTANWETNWAATTVLATSGIVSETKFDEAGERDGIYYLHVNLAYNADDPPRTLIANMVRAVYYVHDYRLPLV